MITAIILTYNEEQHIERCIRSLRPFVKDIVVVDSYSKDNTLQIATDLGASVFQNPWKNYATQFNWALSNADIKNDWVWRIDADEYAEPELLKQLENELPNLDKTVTGVYVKRGIVFHGRKLKYGTWAPRWNLKIFRYGAGECENRWMDEHIKLTHGRTIKINGCQIDNNLNDFTWWTNKHNHYATREMVDMFSIKYGLGSNSEVIPKLFGSSEQRLRWLKLRYANIPLFVRPFINFFYRYILRFGFLDGKQGFLWHVMQGFWYRMLVDAKIWELQRRFGHDKGAIIGYLREEYFKDSDSAT